LRVVGWWVQGDTADSGVGVGSRMLGSGILRLWDSGVVGFWGCGILG